MFSFLIPIPLKRACSRVDMKDGEEERNRVRRKIKDEEEKNGMKEENRGG